MGWTIERTTIRTANRRREYRSPVRDPVTLTIQSPIGREIVGALLDRSPSGFSARYENPDLQRGDRLRFRYKDCEGSAVVIWTRIVGPTIEAGFHILK